MVGEFNGRRFEVGTVVVVAGDDWGSLTMFDLYAKIPSKDANGGKGLWLESVQGERKANKLRDALNSTT